MNTFLVAIIFFLITNISCLDLKFQECPRWQEQLKMIRDNTVYELYFERCLLNGTYAQQLSSALLENHSVRVIDIRSNTLKEKDIEIIANTVSRHVGIEEFLTGCIQTLSHLKSQFHRRKGVHCICKSH
jgi:hypothetical protein